MAKRVFRIGNKLYSPRNYTGISDDFSADAVNWGNINYKEIIDSIINARIQRLTGFNRAITLQMSVNSTANMFLWCESAPTPYIINEGQYEPFTLINATDSFGFGTYVNNADLQTNPFTIAVNPNYYVTIAAYCIDTVTPLTLTVRNLSDSNTILDTLTLTYEVT